MHIILRSNCGPVISQKIQNIDETHLQNILDQVYQIMIGKLKDSSLDSESSCVFSQFYTRFDESYINFVAVMFGDGKFSVSLEDSSKANKGLLLTLEDYYDTETVITGDAVDLAEC